MNALSRTFWAFSVVLLGVSAYGAPALFTFDFDENGAGSVDLRNGAGFISLQGQLMPDPTQAGDPMVLTYLLPDLVVNGDVRIGDNASQTILSDVLRFTDANGDLTGRTADRMIFYSADGPGGPDLADTGLPSTLFPEDDGFGPVESANGSFTWAPGGPTDDVFNGVSEVPEPGTLALLGLGGGALLCAARRRRIAPRGSSSAWFSVFALACCLAPTVGRSQNLVADYRFQSNLTSTVSGAPALMNLGANSFGLTPVDGITWTTLNFSADDGLQVSAPGIAPGATYTIVILFQFQDMAGCRRVARFLRRLAKLWSLQLQRRPHLPRPGWLPAGSRHG